MPKAESTRASRKRKLNNELRDCGDCFQFLCDTPFDSKATGRGKFEAFPRLRSSSNAENREKYIANFVHKRQIGNETQRKVDKLRKREHGELRMRNARLKWKLEMRERKSKADHEETIISTGPPRRVVIDKLYLAGNSARRFDRNRFGVPCTSSLVRTRHEAHSPGGTMDFVSDTRPHGMRVCYTRIWIYQERKGVCLSS